ncbi:MAG TPA: DUF3489 domain-containing protein [Burkholderiaceae bacterium]|nr:DUF3489 domain-containing protein [Burkholderiaceae bacterium]
MTMQPHPTGKRPRKMARAPQPAPPSAPIAAKPPTKTSLVEALLRENAGASLEDLCQATGWLPHTCRAFLTGLRKKGRILERHKRENGATIYRLIAPQAAA